MALLLANDHYIYICIYIYIYIYILPDMSQLPTSPFPKHAHFGVLKMFLDPDVHCLSKGHQGPETFLAPSADKQTEQEKETFTEQLESLGSHQSAQTVNSELCIVQW